MAIYSTFFACGPDDLQIGFPTWLPPLPHPVKREIFNRFTRKTQIIETRKPEWPQSADAAPAKTGYQVVSIQGNYADYLEGRLPPFVRGCPHWCAKGLTDVELKPLAEAAGAEVVFETPLYGPPSANAALLQIPSSLISKLAVNDENYAHEMATRWSTIMCAPEHTHSATGHKLHDGPSVDDMLAIVRPIRELAITIAIGDEIYLLIEW